MASYYCLVSGLVDYGFDSDRKTLNYSAIRDEIIENITKKDHKKLELLMNFYDISNIVAQMTTKSGARYSRLGTLSEETIKDIVVPLLNKEITYDKDELGDITLPKFLTVAIKALTDEEWAEKNSVDVTIPIEQLLYNLYFLETAKCKGFVSKYTQMELNIRNISATVKAKSLGLDATKYIVGGGEVVEALLSSPAPDFGLKAAVPYIDELLAILSNENILKKERDIDLMRLAMVEEMNTFEYFTVDVVLGYYVKIAMIERWLALDPEEGRIIFERIVKELSTMDFTEKLAE